MHREVIVSHGLHWNPTVRVRVWVLFLISLLQGEEHYEKVGGSLRTRART